MNLQYLKTKFLNRFFKTCPKSGRIVGLNTKDVFFRILFPLAGLLALIWFIIRVIPKPTRMDYPCQRVGMPLAASFIAFVGSMFMGKETLRKSRRFFRSGHRLKGSLVFLTGVCVVGVLYVSSVDNTLMSQIVQQQIDNGTDMGSFEPEDAPNSPVGIAQGILPGRVAWAYDPLAAVWDGKTGLFSDATHNSQTRINDMMRQAIISLTNQGTIEKAWEELFIYHNEKKGKGKVAYQPGEKIAVKINLNNNGGNNRVDASPQTVYALLTQLVDVLKVPEECITVYDAQRRGISIVYNYNFPMFRNVNYQQWGGFVPGVINYSSEITDEEARSLAKAANDADYMINMALLKRHSQPTSAWRDGNGQTGITSTGKNQFGSVGKVPPLHYSIRDWSSFRGKTSYNCIVDLMAHEKLGRNTLLYITDALYPTPIHNGKAVKFKLPPFNDSWTSSIFTSLDEVAMQSVMLDFIHSELPLPARADNFLHEAAMIGNPPSGIKYIGREQGSLGVHEHWNNPVDRKYSRDLGTGEGIELFRVPLDMTRPAVEYFYADKPFSSPGEEITLHWKTSNTTYVMLNGKLLPPEGSLKMDSRYSQVYYLHAFKNKEVNVWTLAVPRFRTIDSSLASEAKLSGSAKINDQGYLEYENTRDVKEGDAQWQMYAPEAGIYYIGVNYTGSEPQPSYLYINEELITENYGYESTEGNNPKVFYYPVYMKQGVNSIRLQHLGRRSNMIRSIQLFKELT